MPTRRIHTALLTALSTLLASGAVFAQEPAGATWQAACQWMDLTASSLTRTPLVDDVVEYQARIRVGPGEHDWVGLHRVVREASPWDPVETPDAILLVHGSASNFRTAFAPALADGELFAPEHGLAPHLAQGDIDVWGIDLRWTFVPAETTDFSDLAGWNFASHLEDMRKVATIARLVRWLDGSGYDRLFIGGHSLGGDLTYAYANADSQRPIWWQDVRGIVPIEINYKLTSPESQTLKDEAALRYQTYRALYDSGEYALSLAAQLQPLIALGLTAPDDPSPVVPGFTNLEAATSVFSLTHMFYAPLPAYTPAYHFLAGTFDEQTGAPTGYQFIDRSVALEMAAHFPPYQPLIEAVEVDALISDAVNVPYDDHLDEITVPVLYVGTAGGFGAAGLETLELLGSTDQSSLIVQLYPEGSEAVDFGHVDMLWAESAPELVWTPIGEWIRTTP